MHEFNIKSQPSEENNILQHYSLQQTLGEGTFGKVKLAIHNQTKEKVAVKVLEKAKIQDSTDVKRIAKEIEILKKLRHPNIVMLYEIIETEKELFLIMEYANGGELFEFIVKNQRLREKVACKFLLQILSGVEYIHKIGVVHRDLKPENLLLDSNQNIKIVDFGLSNTYKPNELLKTACGSPCYAAPEMIQGLQYSGYLVDIWSCGIILFAMLCGYLPFEDPNTNSLYKKIIAGDVQIPKNISPEAKDLIKRILQTDPTKRYHIPQIRNHPWCRQLKIEENAGIIVGHDQIPIDEHLIDQLHKVFNVDAAQCRKMVQRNRHNPVTTLYYLHQLSSKRTRTSNNYFKKEKDRQAVMPEKGVEREKEKDRDREKEKEKEREKEKEKEKEHEKEREKEQAKERERKDRENRYQREGLLQQPLEKGHALNTSFIHNEPRKSTSRQKRASPSSESPKALYVQLRRDIIRRSVVKNAIPPVQLKPITQAVNNSISSVGTTIATPISTQRRTEDSQSVERVKVKPFRDRAISAINETRERTVMKVHKGAFNLRCTTSRDPNVVVDELKLVLNQQGIKYESKTKFELTCQSGATMKFELSIRSLQHQDEIYLLRGKHQSGDYNSYIALMNRILQQLRF